MPYRTLLLFLFLAVATLVAPRLSAQTLDARTYIHPRAKVLMPEISKEIDRLFPELNLREYVPALIEHESCVTLRAAKCWNSTSELRTSREQGVGLGQLTRAWDRAGKLRFDNLEAMKKKYPSELGELDWTTFKDRSDLQIRAILLMLRDDYLYFRTIKDETLRLQMTDSAYNGGRRDAIRARETCNLARGCDSNIWFDNIERYCVKSKVPNPGYGGRNACDINNGHVADVFKVRMHKFKPYMRKQ